MSAKTKRGRHNIYNEILDTTTYDILISDLNTCFGVKKDSSIWALISQLDLKKMHGDDNILIHREYGD